MDYLGKGGALAHTDFSKLCSQSERTELFHFVHKNKVLNLACLKLALVFTFFVEYIHG